jgi:ketosteroid isomerase-like protein
MPIANVESLRRGYEAFSRGDWADAFALAHPQIELRTADRITNPGTYRGREELTRFFRDLFEPFEEVLAEPEEFFDCGDRIVAFVRVRSRPRGSIAVVDNRIGHLWTFEDGKVTRLQIFPDRRDALKAVGLSEADARARAIR